jgi:hypothetical protein
MCFVARLLGFNQLTHGSDHDGLTHDQNPETSKGADFEQARSDKITDDADTV